MRIRYLKPDFFIDEDIAELPPLTRILFQGLWCSADKAGRLEDRPKKLKVQLMPYDNIDIEKALQILAKQKTTSPQRSFIIRYEINGEKYIQIINWDKHQKPHHTEKASIIPPYNPLLKEKDKENGESKSKVKNESAELDNAPLTVKPDIDLSEEKFSYLKDKKFLQTFNDYLDMRKTKKPPKPATDVAKKLVLTHLHKYNINTAILMLEKSIKNSWTDVYELDKNKSQEKLKSWVDFAKEKENEE